MVVPAGVRLRPEEIGGLLALGITRVKNQTLPRVGIISSETKLSLRIMSPSPTGAGYQ
jgi:molybdopterin biosynthesis enzyme